MEYIKWLDEISLDQIDIVGGKTASLGEMYNGLRSTEVQIPFGFAITTVGYLDYIKKNNIDLLIEDYFYKQDSQSKQNLMEKSNGIRLAFTEGDFPLHLKKAITSAYNKLLQKENITSVAIRSSATTEDLDNASFAGQQDSFLNIQSEEELLEKCKQCFGSLYTERAVSYRQDKGFSQTNVALSICVQRMIRSDIGCSGVMFTIEMESGFRDAILINSSWGLGENIVKGEVDPDEFTIFKTTLRKGFYPILNKVMGSKKTKQVYRIANGNGNSIKKIRTPVKEQATYSLDDDEIIKLARCGLIIEKYYTKKKRTDLAMDIEWAKDGINDELYIVQARPETIHSPREINYFTNYKLNHEGQIILKGQSIGHLIGSGKVRVIRGPKDLEDFKKNEILVSEYTSPDWEPYLKMASGIITDHGGRTCHAAIIGRELGIPTIVGTKIATSRLRTGQEVTISCASGNECYVYNEKIPFTEEKVMINEKSKIKTNIMMNLSNPSMAFKSSLFPNDGVGLIRTEFIISNLIQVHPLALINYKNIDDKIIKNKINRLTFQYKNKEKYFIDKLASGLSQIAAAFYPKPVIMRFSDFKSNEYSSLIGGKAYETEENNPMIGFRGAFRYYHQRYNDAFRLECNAVKKVRQNMGLRNLKVMVPFCRSINEANKVINLLEVNGLKQGEDELEIYCMCEVPSNVFLAADFAKIFDGISIGSNDLTQLILGIDRDNETLESIFDENNEAIKKAISITIKETHKMNKKISVCGQKPSDDFNFTKFLIKNDIDSISLTPDSILNIRKQIENYEAHL